MDSEFEDDELPTKRVCRVTTWMQYLQKFATTDGLSVKLLREQAFVWSSKTAMGEKRPFRSMHIPH